MTSSALAGDLKYTQRLSTGSGTSHDTVYYLKGERKRIDSRSYVGGETPQSFVYGPHTAMIMQCDLSRVLHLNLDTKKYYVQPIKPLTFSSATSQLDGIASALSTAASPSHSQESVVRVEETGDKKQFHNREAWLVRQTTESTLHYGGQTHKSTSVDESWYIDLDVPMYCPKQLGLAPNTKVQSRLAIAGDNVTEIRTGTARIGFPISHRNRVTSSPGSREFGMNVVDWSEETLDPKLFEVPDGFVETKNWEDVQPALRATAGGGILENLLRWAKSFFSAP
jgi:hypothetical protein